MCYVKNSRRDRWVVAGGTGSAIEKASLALEIRSSHDCFELILYSKRASVEYDRSKYLSRVIKFASPC